MKKSLFVLLILLLMSVFIITSCGDKGDENPTDTSTPGTSETSDNNEDNTDTDTDTDTNTDTDTDTSTDTSGDVPTHDHNWEEKSRDGNCGQSGTITYKCSVCNEERTERYSSLPHIEGEHRVTVQPTCEKDGTEVIRCSICNRIVKSIVLPSFGGHKFELSETVGKTCTTEGYELWKCVNEGCTEQERRNVVSASHEWEYKETAADCDNDGEKTYICKVCEEKDTSRTEVIEKLGHDYQQDGEIVAPTCATPGYTNEKCTRCGTTRQTNSVPALGHIKSETLEIISESTCQTAGKEGYRCDRCGEIPDEYITELPLAAHDFSAKTLQETLPATCTDNERLVYSCKWKDDGCTETLVEDKEGGEQAFGHIPDGIFENVTDPTCATDGYTTYKCQSCGNNYKDNIVPATGEHVFDIKTDIVTAPTCSAEGHTTYKCSGDPNCTATTEKDYTAKTAHSLEKLPEGDIFCSECGAIYENVRYIIDIKGQGTIETEGGNLEVIFTGSKKPEDLKFTDGIAVWESDADKNANNGIIYVTTASDSEFTFEYKDSNGEWHTIGSDYIHAVDGGVYADMYKSDDVKGIRVTATSGADVPDAIVDIYA